MLQTECTADIIRYYGPTAINQVDSTHGLCWHRCRSSCGVFGERKKHCRSVYPVRQKRNVISRRTTPCRAPSADKERLGRPNLEFCFWCSTLPKSHTSTRVHRLGGLEGGRILFICIYSLLGTSLNHQQLFISILCSVFDPVFRSCCFILRIVASSESMIMW